MEMFIRRWGVGVKPETRNLPYETRSVNLGLIALADHARCGARLRKKDRLCQAPAMKNGRCRLHGGLSTGAKTEAGKARSRRGNWKHGDYSAEAKREQREMREFFRLVEEVLNKLN